MYKTLSSVDKPGKCPICYRNRKGDGKLENDCECILKLEEKKDKELGSGDGNPDQSGKSSSPNEDKNKAASSSGPKCNECRKNIQFFPVMLCKQQMDKHYFCHDCRPFALPKVTFLYRIFLFKYYVKL